MTDRFEKAFVDAFDHILSQPGGVTTREHADESAASTSPVSLPGVHMPTGEVARSRPRPRPRQRVPWLPAAAAVLAAVGLVWGVLGLQVSGSGAREGSVAVSGSDALPSATVEDWVTYSDALVAITVLGETELPPTGEERAAGEGLIGRIVTVRVDETFWQRPGLVDGPPPEMSWNAGGWVFDAQGGRRPIVAIDAPMLLVGHVYLAPVVKTNLGEAGNEARWMPLSATAVLPYADGIIGAGETIRNAQGVYRGESAGRTPLRDEVWGKSGNQMANLLRSGVPDRRASDKMTADPMERLRAVQADSTPAPPGPGER